MGENAGPSGGEPGATQTFSSPLPRDRLVELDALGAIVPVGRAEQLAGVLTDNDIATLRHIAEQGMGANTLRALTSDLGYIEAWATAVTGSELSWPASLDLTLAFVAHHMWDPAEKARDPHHGMPDAVRCQLVEQGFLRSEGPHAPSTVRRRLSSWSTLHGWRNVEGPFGSPALRKALRLATRAHAGPRRRKSPRAVTLEVLEPILSNLDAQVAQRPVASAREARSAWLAAVRDRALIGIAFASGGRRRSEMAGLTLPQISQLSGQAEGEPPTLSLRLGRTKTEDAGDEGLVMVSGRSVEDLDDWLEASGIQRGAIFRRIDRWGAIGPLPLSDQSVNAILKRRVSESGLDPQLFTAHGIRAGYLTEAALAGVSLPEAMTQSRHRSVQQASSYFNAAGQARSKAARLLP